MEGECSLHCADPASFRNLQKTCRKWFNDHGVLLLFSQGQSCDSFRPFVGGDDFRECCDCCALGIRAKHDKDVHCSLPVFRSLVTHNTSLPCLKVFKECCSGEKCSAH